MRDMVTVGMYELACYEACVVGPVTCRQAEHNTYGIRTAYVSCQVKSRIFCAIQRLPSSLSKRRLLELDRIQIPQVSASGMSGLRVRKSVASLQWNV